VATADELEAVELAIRAAIIKVGGGLLVDLFWPSLFVPATPHFALVVVYLLMSVGSLRTFGGSRRRVSLVVSAVIGIVITAGAIFASFYKVTSPTILAPWFAGPAGGRLRVHLRAARPAAGRHRTEGPERDDGGLMPRRAPTRRHSARSSSAMGVHSAGATSRSTSSPG
jgi:hypothetical protein